MVTTITLMVVLTVQLSLHTSMGADGLPTCVQPADGCPITTMQAKNLYDAFYNDGLFDNSKGTLTIRTGAYAAWDFRKRW
jgi:phosphoribosylcarboxyaminoimidazole (NCAIR) mutase